jgi:predicted amidohydrolase YtcJ
MNIKQKIVGLLVACCSVVAVANTSTVYFNGDILTMQGNSPQYVEALVAQNDKILFVGNKSQALAQAGSSPTLHDLKGATLMPGFIDSWGHFTLVAQNTLTTKYLDPCRTIEYRGAEETRHH